MLWETVPQSCLCKHGLLILDPQSFFTYYSVNNWLLQRVEEVGTSLQIIARATGWGIFLQLCMVFNIEFSQVHHKTCCATNRNLFN